MMIKHLCFNPFSENCYVLFDDSKEAVIIDPGCYSNFEKEALCKYIQENGLSIRHVLLTHIHIDHIFGTPYLKEHFNVSPEAHEEDLFLIEGSLRMAAMFGIPYKENIPFPCKYLKEGDRIFFGHSSLQVLHIPGHSPGSIAFYSEKDNAVFTGDALFAGSVGRTDLEGGDHSRLIQSIRDKLFTLPSHTKVYPGHGPMTDIETEKNYNPYL
ncbi:MAG: MBL fold metallo-hydrolase [Bacteroidales bacterium]|nr:MBL fold metallo-hydrolase [Bacteroidales bacterium]